MEPIKIKVTEADAIVTQAPTITAGMAGLMVEFEFDETWEGFTKTAVFKAGDVVRDVVGIGTSCKVPPEVLVLPYRTLRIGVYGVSADGEVTIPTVWAAVDEIRLGADPSGDESTEPTLPVWQQILNKVNGCVKTVNGTAPDENGNVDTLPVFDLRSLITIDTDDTQEIQVSDDVLEQFHACVKNGTFIGMIDWCGESLTATFTGNEDDYGYDATCITFNDGHDYLIRICDSTKEDPNPLLVINWLPIAQGKINEVLEVIDVIDDRVILTVLGESGGTEIEYVQYGSRSTKVEAFDAKKLIAAINDCKDISLHYLDMDGGRMIYQLTAYAADTTQFTFNCPSGLYPGERDTKEIGVDDEGFVSKYSYQR